MCSTLVHHHHHTPTSTPLLVVVIGIIILVEIAGLDVPQSEVYSNFLQ
jgi:hypothetical protein